MGTCWWQRYLKYIQSVNTKIPLWPVETGGVSTVLLVRSDVTDVDTQPSNNINLQVTFVAETHNTFLHKMFAYISQTHHMKAVTE